MKAALKYLEDIIKKHYPKTFEALLKATNEAIEINSNKIEAFIVSEELQNKTFDDTKHTSKQFTKYLTGLGYYAVSVGEYKDGHNRLPIKIWVLPDVEINTMLSK